MTDSQKSPWKDGIESAKEKFLPGVIVWSLGLGLLTLYFTVDPVKEALKSAVDWKKATSPLVTILSSVLFGALLPDLVQRILQGSEKAFSKIQLAALSLFWAASGCATDVFYKTLGNVVGDDRGPLEVFLKVLANNFAYAPLIQVPLVVIVYLFISKEFSFADTKRALQKKSFRHRYISTFVANSMIWVPAAAIIFSVPGGLQLLFSNLILGLWGMILKFMSNDG